MTKKDNYSCHVAIQAALGVIGSKWRPLILWHLLEKTMRFNELEKSIGDISQKMLTSELRGLESDGIVKRQVYPQIPPKVEYSMTDYGLTLSPVLARMADWGNDHRACQFKKIKIK